MDPNSSIYDWRAEFGVVDPTGREAITYSLWERQQYVSGTTEQLQFFNQGAQTGINGNLTLGGQLPNGQAFLVQALKVHVAQGPFATAAAAPADGPAQAVQEDIFNLIHNATAEIRIGDKTYGRWPLWMLPPGGGISGFLSAAGSLTAPATSVSSFAQSGVPDPRAVYTLPIPVVLPPQFNFDVTLTWDAPQTLLAGDPLIFFAGDYRDLV